MQDRAKLVGYLENVDSGKDSNTHILFASQEKGTIPGTITESIEIQGNQVTKYTNEFWTSKQRQASSIHEISYRACFKPQLPRFFIELLSAKGDTVYDPFSGRGTTCVEAGLLGRRVVSNDINPLGKTLTEPRLAPPSPQQVADRLAMIRFDNSLAREMDLSMFFHEDTYGEILSIRKYLLERREAKQTDDIDRWISMVATNRLTGHSTGFFSVYTLPPNQAVSPASQIRINQQRNQKPVYRSTRELINKKTLSLLRNLTKPQKDSLRECRKTASFLTKHAANTPEIPPDSVQLTVTSPPFLNIVQYSTDNWLRCWFNGLDAKEISKQITMAGTLKEWSASMGQVFVELFRVTKPNGWVAFEVGEVKNRTVLLDEHVVPLGIQAGFECHGILVNEQEFTKTANIWGVRNMRSGTNTNRIVLLRKPD